MTRRDFWALALFGCVLALHFSDTWFTGRTYFARDLLYVFQPQHAFTAQNVQAGQIPWWNPYTAAGVYWLADPQTGLWYPGNLLFWVFSFLPGFKFFQAAQFFLAGLGAYLLARRFRSPRWQAALAAILWSMNGFYLTRLEFPSLLGVIAWAPWLALAFSAGNVWLAGGTLALGITAGHWPHVAWSFALAAAAFPGRWRKWAPAAVLGLGLAAVQVIPAVDGLWASARLRSGFAMADSLRYSLRLSDFQALLLPPAPSLAAFAYSGERYFWLGAYYLGAIGLVLGLAALLRAKRRWALLGLGLVGALLALGAHGPLEQIFRLPLFRSLRYPPQFVFWTLGALLIPLAAVPWRPRRPSLGPILLFAAACELLCWGMKLAPTAGSGFFHARPEWALPLYGQPGRLFFSPEALSSQSAEGASAEEAWSRLRLKLFNLGNLPYRLEAVHSFGFAFVDAHTEGELNAAYNAADFSSAAPSLLRLGVRWIAAPRPLSASALSPLSEVPWYLYEWKGVQTLAASGNSPWTRTLVSPTHRIYRGAAEGDLRLAESFHPGWQAFAEGGRLAISQEEFILPLPAGARRVDLRFRPFSALSGVVLSLAAVAFCIIAFITHVRKRRGYLFWEEV